MKISLAIVCVSGALGVTEDLFLANGRGLFGQYIHGDVHSLIAERMKSNPPSIQGGLSLLSSSNALRGGNMRIGDDPTHCHEMFDELAVIYNQTLSDLESRVYGYCFQELIDKNATETRKTAEKKVKETVDLPKAESDIRITNEAIGILNGQITEKEGELQSLRDQCESRLTHLKSLLDQANLTFTGMKNTGNEFDQLLTNHSALSEETPGLVQISQHTGTMRQKICNLLKNSQELPSKIIDVNSELAECDKTIDIDHEKLQNIFHDLYNTTVHIYMNAKEKYDEKKTQCDQDISGIEGEIDQLESDRDAQNTRLTKQESIAQGIRDDISTLNSELRQLILDALEIVNDCNRDIGETLDNILCPTMSLRNVLIEKCADFKNKEIVDCKVSLFNTPRCINNAFSLTRSIHQNKNEIGFPCPPLNFDLICENDQHVCALGNYWGIKMEIINPSVTCEGVSCSNGGITIEQTTSNKWTVKSRDGEYGHDERATIRFMGNGRIDWVKFDIEVGVCTLVYAAFLLDDGSLPPTSDRFCHGVLPPSKTICVADLYWETDAWPSKWPGWELTYTTTP